MSQDALRILFDPWRRWSAMADRSEAGWESCFPAWQELIEAASETMLQNEVTAETALILAKCWSASQEDEERLTFASEHLEQCWPTLQTLAQSSLPGCRWQVYEAIVGAGPAAESMLRCGILDEDPYSRRRALLPLARIRPSDAQSLAESFVRDSDPYMRQAAIDMILAAVDLGFQREALSLLRADSVEHVRKAAETEWQRIRGKREEVSLCHEQPH